MAQPQLRQLLRTWQIFFIAISAVIGGGFFPAGEALRVAGPAGTLLSIGIMGFIAIMVNEGNSEFTQLFPAPNAIVEWVSAFVDRELGLVIGIAYWYTHASIFATMTLFVANFSSYWDNDGQYQHIIFIVVPLLLVAINFVGVGLFGYVEAIGGALKIAIVMAIGIIMYIIIPKNGKSNPITDSFVNKQQYTSGSDQAVCFALPLIAYTFLGEEGLEVVAVTAFEAQTTKSLRLPSQSIGFVFLSIYMFCAIGLVLNVKNDDPRLPQTYDGSRTVYPTFNTASLVIIAAIQSGRENLPGVLNGLLMFCCLSAGNTSLYVASRTLYGMTWNLENSRSIFGRAFSKLSIVVARTGVPAAALLFSALAFIWLPFLLKLQGKGNYRIDALMNIISASSSICCLLVWASLSLAFIRYKYWLKQCHEHLHGEHEKYRRNETTYMPYTVFAFAQPIPAYLGLFGSLLVVLVFTSAPWWSSEVNPNKVLVAYLAPTVLTVLFVIFKLAAWNRRGWNKQGWKGLWLHHGNDFQKFEETVDRLAWLKRADLVKAQQGDDDRAIPLHGVES